MATALLRAFAWGLLMGPRWAGAELPAFLLEPPARLLYSNSSGTLLGCALRPRAGPPARISWQLAGGEPASSIPGLREVLANGSLYLPPFSAEQLRAEVHGAQYRCRADTPSGTFLSRDSSLTPVISEELVPRVTSTHGIAGNTAVLRCSVPGRGSPPPQNPLPGQPALYRPAGWYRDQQLLLPDHSDNGDRVVVAGGGWELHVRSASLADSLVAFSCVVWETLTGQRRRSLPAHITVSESRGGVPPRLVARPPAELTVLRGQAVDLSCVAQGSPPPVASWRRQGAERPGARLLGRAGPELAGRWTCRAASALGEVTAGTVLTVLEPLAVLLEPRFQRVNSGDTAVLNCTVIGGEGGSVQWVREGAPLRGGGLPLPSPHLLRLVRFGREDAGLYQCLVSAPGGSAQAVAELRLGDTAPELQYTFIEQALRPGPPVSLRCSATGAPAPSFSWLLDGQELLPSHRYSMGQFQEREEVVSHLNLSSSRAEDGGLYCCRAVNSVGEAAHTARLNIYGPPYIRFVAPIRAVAGSNITIYCPYSGYPISGVKWERQGALLGPDPRHGRDGEGGLRVSAVGTGDAGAYTCSATGPQGELARRELQLIVLKPPQLAPFLFPPNVEEGSNIQATCSVMSGDQPIYFTWFKNNQPIPASLDVEQKSLEFFSILIIKKVSSSHSGTYSCVASNAAAKANYSAPLVVRVAPQWIQEPQDVSALMGSPVRLPCSARGFPEPQITWMKSQGTTPQNYHPLDSAELVENGSLSLVAVSARDEGYYLCKVTNTIGSGLSKAVFIRVNEPPRFEVGSRNVSTRRGESVNLVCEVFGDDPMQVVWTHNMNRLDANNYRLIISEAKTESGVRSQLSVRQAERQDSGLYKCQAGNSFGRSELLIYLAVQERPEPPSGLEVVEVQSRAVRLSWAPPFAGHSPLQAYLLQYRPLHSSDWAGHTTHNVTILPTRNLEYPDSKEQALVEGLQPASAYVFRLLAINQIDRSSFSDSVMAKTQEEAPLEAPRSVQVQATGPGELHITWQPPPRDSWNGELLGYTVRWAGERGEGAGEGRAPAPALQYSLGGLARHSRYLVTVAAFNGAAHGPPSAPAAATTLEGVPESPPEDVLCSALSSQSLRVSWRPPPPASLGGVLQGYRLHYRPLNLPDDTEQSAAGSVKRTSGLETQLQGLLPHTEYSLSVRAYTGAGEGVPSAPITCTTHEDAPGQPDSIKVSPLSADSVLVSWLPPSKPNGRIKHYTVYVREASRSGKHQAYPVAANESAPSATGPGELAHAVSGLREGTQYEFWVSATTAFGEGKATEILMQEPSSKSGARISSFGGPVSAGAGAAVQLPCRVTGLPAPRTRWLAAGNPVTHQRGLTVAQSGDLIIPRLDASMADNFTCVSRNSIGEDSVTYSVRVLLPPGSPRLLLRPPSAPHSLTLQIEPPVPRVDITPINGYTLNYKYESEEWQSLELPADTGSYTLKDLRCGSLYHLYLQAHNRVGTGSPSEVITASTKGGVPRIPEESELLQSNSSVLRVQLAGWEEVGCPLQVLGLQYRRLGAGPWASLPASPQRPALFLAGLTPATWYQLRLRATNEAGTTIITYNFATTTITGARIAAPSNYPDDDHVEEDYLDSIIVSVLCASITIFAIILAYLLLKKRRQEIPNEDKSEEDNCRNCQQAYTPLPHKPNKIMDDSSELYEISPYATFSVTGGAGAVAPAPSGGRARGVSASTLDYTLQFRTFGHQENEASTSHRGYTYRNKQEESSLSTADTVQVRRGRRAGRGRGGGGAGGSSDDSEGSPHPPAAHCPHRRNVATSIYTEM